MGERTRNWNFLVYPESAAGGWEQRLDDMHISWARSPLHQFDVNEETGELKKPHYHCILIYDTLKTYEQASEVILSAVGEKGFKRPERCHSLRGSVRYFWHLDDHTKFQYPFDLCTARFHGIDYDSCVSPTSSEKQKYIGEMIQYCCKHDINEYADLVEYALDAEPEWLYMLSSCCSIFMSAYLRSRRYRSGGPS